MLGPTVWAFTELGRKDVKVDILISRLMGLHVQQFAFKLTNLAQMSLVLQFITGQVIFLSNGRQWLKAGVNYRFWMCCWKPIKRSIKKWKTAFPRMYFTAASWVVRCRHVCCGIQCVAVTVFFWKESLAASRWERKAASALWRETVTVMDCS